MRMIIVKLTINNFNAQWTTDNFRHVYDQVLLVMKVKKRYRNRLPWLTSGLKESIKHKKKFFLRFHRNIQLLIIKRCITTIKIRLPHC